LEDILGRFRYLHHLWGTQQLTEEEQQEYFFLLDKYGAETVLEPLMQEDWNTAKDEGALELAARHAMAGRILSGNRPRVSRVYLIRRWAAAAAILVLIGAGAGFYFSRQPAAPTGAVADIAPGGNGAILTLGDGTQVVLDSLGDGIIAKQKGSAAVIKNGQLAYQAIHTNNPEGEVIYNTMSTPRGRQFQLRLPDGTNVWMNAATSIRYPTAFAGNERNVEVTGEAYFEVAPDKAKPFRVHFTASAEGGREGTVLALGTSFNVCAYRDDAAAKVTLLEGKVMVSPSPVEKHSEILTPGMQAAVAYGKSRSAGMTVKTADTTRVMAWKNGILNLHEMGLGEVMKQISRWYNIDVVYEGNIPEVTFWGEISRSENLSTVLVFMAESGVKFKIDDAGKKIIIRK
jgi:transmembrane sensor